MVGNIPAQISHFRNLTRLTISQNPNLGGTLPDFSSMPLTSLQLQQNAFTGSVPRFDVTPGQYTQASLYMYDNKLTHISEEFCQDATRLFPPPTPPTPVRC
jgi:hypothetical protein